MFLVLGLAGDVQAQPEGSILARAAIDSAPLKAAVAPSYNALGISSPTWHTHFDEQAARVLRENSAARQRS